MTEYLTSIGAKSSFSRLAVVKDVDQLELLFATLKLQLALFQSYHNFLMPNNELVFNK